MAVSCPRCGAIRLEQLPGPDDVWKCSACMLRRAHGQVMPQVVVFREGSFVMLAIQREEGEPVFVPLDRRLAVTAAQDLERASAEVP